MGTTIKPIMFKRRENPGYLDHLAEEIKDQLGNDADLLLDYPAVYIHVWRSKNDILNNRWSIYVGETNDIIARTNEHWAAAKVSADKIKTGNWQHNMLKAIDDDGNKTEPTVYFFGHQLFTKSMTLDIENKLIDFCLAMETSHMHNGRGNAQGFYHGHDNVDDIFGMIWRKLRADNPDLFMSEASIKKSAIYKASPNHRLTDDQKKAKQKIIDRTCDAILAGKQGQLIFVEGEAGTGKTVLTSSTFYEMLDNELLKNLNLKCFMLINHVEQRKVYENMARKMGYSDEIIQIPTTFLKNHSVLVPGEERYIPDEDNIVDVLFVDEAHLLWNQNNQDFNTKFKDPQLDELIKRARVTVIMFDSHQFLHKGQLFTMDYISKKRDLAKSQGPDPANNENNYIELANQLRMNCSKDTMKWVDDFSKELLLSDLNLNSKYMDTEEYEIRVFDTPEDLHEAIKAKAAKEESQLSRLIASYDWKYVDEKNNSSSQNYWKVDINGWEMPWNEELFRVELKNGLNARQKRVYDALDWAEKDYTINEVGSTFTIQGFDLAYAGVILGPSIKYNKETKTIWFDEKERAWRNMTGNRTLSDGTTVNVTNQISQNELRVLMTRGTKGIYLYACDDALRDALKNCILIKK